MACAHGGFFHKAKKIIDAAISAKQMQFNLRSLILILAVSLALMKILLHDANFTLDQWEKLLNYAKKKR